MRFGSFEGVKILDLGCGNAELVKIYRDHGVNCLGCDFLDRMKNVVDFDSLLTSGVIREIEEDPYRLPFDDEAFDLVVTDHVIEHVKDKRIFFAEISRVLGRNGKFMGFYPSENRLREAHTLAPLAPFVKCNGWLLSCALLGFRKPTQSHMSRMEIYSENSNYVQNNLYYENNITIMNHCEEFFSKVSVPTKDYFSVIKKKSLPIQILRKIPYGDVLYCGLSDYFIWAEK